MINLPHEVQLEIAEYLDALDLLSLQLTCKRLYNLISNHERVIWRHVLRRQCAQNSLFWPTFQDHTTPSGHKAAAVLPFRATKTFRGAGEPIQYREYAVAFPDEVFGTPLGEIEDIYLVPGGRFLLTFERGWMNMWELTPGTAAAAKIAEGGGAGGEVKLEVVPRLLLRFDLGSFDTVAGLNMEDDERIQVVMSYTATKEQMGPTLSATSACLTVYGIFEIRLAEGKKSFEMKLMATFGFVNDEEELVNVYTILGHQVTFHVSGSEFDTTVVWDYVTRAHVGWRVEGVQNICEVFSSPDHVFYINSDGVHVIKMPQFPPPPKDDDHLALSAFLFKLQETKLAPRYAFLYDEPYQYSPEQIIGADLRWALPDKDPLIFLIKEQPPSEPGVLKLHRYHFTFDSSVIGTEEEDFNLGSLELVETTKLTVGENANMASRPYQMYDGRLAMCWADELPDAEWHASQLFISLSPPLFDAASQGRRGNEEKETDEKEEMRLIPFMGKIPLNRSAMAYEFSAATGQAAILWSDEDEATGNMGKPYVTCYNFLDSP